MKIETLSMGHLASNCYILSIEDEVLIIDPSLDPNNDASRIISAVGSKKVLAILLTHGHFDHISAVDILVEKYACDLYMYEKEHHYLKEPQMNLSPMIGEEIIIESKPLNLALGNHSIGSFDFNVLLTPGHTSESISMDFNNHIFDGDFIFQGSIGRTDFPSGSMETMRESIRNFDKLYKDLNPKLYPGHGPNTQYQDEKETNPYLLDVL